MRGAGETNRQRTRDLQAAEDRFHTPTPARPFGLACRLGGRAPSGFLGVEVGRLCQRRRTAAQPLGHPELTRRVRAVGVLHLFEQVLHA